MTRSSTGKAEHLSWVLQHRWGIAVSLTVILSSLALYASFWIRFDGAIPNEYILAFYRALPLAIAIKLIVFEYYNLHRGLWRYAGIDDLTRIIKASSVSSLALIISVVFLYHTDGFPRSAFLLDWFFTIFFSAGIRGATRIYRERFAQQRRSGPLGRILIIGAGDTAELAIRDLRSKTQRRKDIVGFLDDDPAKQRTTIHGHQVLGPLNMADAIIRSKNVTEVLIAMPTAPKRIVRDIVHLCAEQRIQARIIPAISDYVSGSLEVQPIRNLEITDLLERDPVKLDGNLVQRGLTAKRVLVTGAGGSIGSELVRQIAACDPSMLIMLDVAESALFDIDNEIAKAKPGLTRRPVIADIRDSKRINAVFEELQPDYVFHAAAYKHVPLMELHPMEAIQNNILGTHTLAQTAKAHNVERFVLISTDKAVKPENVMGATKRVAEMLMNLHNDGNTRFVAVRFGNVLGSAGSVVPIFKRQIAAGGPILVTHEDATRFFMTIPEASQLVLQVGVTETNGNIFVLDMGKPVRIVDLAKNMIELSGLIPDEDIEIQFTGLRPGEKIHEELEAYGENLEPTSIPKINVLRSNETSSAQLLGKGLNALSDALSRGDIKEARSRLMNLVKEKKE
jgi:FlaA1/EpsC-like NDP-sugar epimerase